MGWLRAANRLSPVIIVVLLAGCSLHGYNRDVPIVCDGTFPQWVLDAQGYDGGGCAEALPFDQAPKDANWTPVCTGYCLCDRGQLWIDDACKPISSSEPWPASVHYP
jgi:hypothetical protein